MQCTIIIPCYNEAKTIKKLLDTLINASKNNGYESKCEIIVVDDGSSDNSVDIISRIRHPTLKLIRHTKNLGKTEAIKTGLKVASGEYIAIQDADLEYNPSDLFKLINKAFSGNLDVLYGSRVLAPNPTAYPAYYLGSRVITSLFNKLFAQNITDLPTCYKIFKKSLIQPADLNHSRFSFCADVSCIFAKKNIKIKELPISYLPRTSAQGKKIKSLDGLQFIWIIVKHYLDLLLNTEKKKEA